MGRISALPGRHLVLQRQLGPEPGGVAEARSSGGPNMAVLQQDQADAAAPGPDAEPDMAYDAPEFAQAAPTQ